MAATQRKPIEIILHLVENENQIIISSHHSGSASDNRRERTYAVACIGNSITYGYGLKNRSEECYPAVLGIMLGENYTVENFGISARTLLNKGDHPYMQENAVYRSKGVPPRHSHH